MDALTQSFQSFLVRLHYEPECVSHKVSHYLEHLFQLLEADDEEAVLHYFGILGHEQLSLDEVASVSGRTPQEMLDHIHHQLRRLAVTPEWEMLRAHAHAQEKNSTDTSGT